MRFDAGVEHPLALQPQAELELVGRQDLVIERAVVGGVGVVLATGVLDVLEEFAASDVLGAFEQQVLEEVGHAGALRVFVLGADVVHHGDGHDGGAVVFVQDDVEPVVEVVFLEFDGGPLGGKAPMTGREAEGQWESHGPVFGLDGQDSGCPGKFVATMDHAFTPASSAGTQLQTLYAADRIALSVDARQNVATCPRFLAWRSWPPAARCTGSTRASVNWPMCAWVRMRLHQLQDNILRSHAAGLGAPLPPEVVRWMLLFKVCGLIRGHSGVQPETVDRLVAFFNEGLMPVVPRQGSLGASGDLAPLSHMCLPLLGEGELMERRADGEWITRPAAEVLAEKGWSPISLGPKEGLALINGTQMMSALLAHALHQLEILWQQAHGIAA